jgi:hypothetical protein
MQPAAVFSLGKKNAMHKQYLKQKISKATGFSSIEVSFFSDIKNLSRAVKEVSANAPLSPHCMGKKRQKKVRQTL